MTGINEHGAPYSVHLVLVATLYVVATVALWLRFWVRTRISKTLAYDDWLLLASHIVNIVAAAMWLHVQKAEQRYRQQAEQRYQQQAPELFELIAVVRTRNATIEMSSDAAARNISLVLLFMSLPLFWSRYRLPHSS